MSDRSRDDFCFQHFVHLSSVYLALYIVSIKYLVIIILVHFSIQNRLSKRLSLSSKKKELRQRLRVIGS